MTAHRHDLDAVAGTRCRVCTANDHSALIEELAAALWESRRTGHVDDRPWEEAGSYWQLAFREIASDALDHLRS